MSRRSRPPRRPAGRRSAARRPADRRPEARAAPDDAFEAEVLPGLAPFARAELAATGRARLGDARADDRGRDRTRDRARDATDDRADAVRFAWSGDAAPLHALRTVTSVQRVLTFGVPRPKALLGDAHARRLGALVAAVVRDAPAPFSGVRLEAAGADTPVMRRVREALAEAAGLPDDPDGGDLQVRVRPASGGVREGGWEVLVRLTPRPLSARAWRVANRPGGLNACVAAAAWDWIGHAPGDRVLNAMCGTGTLLIERAVAGPAARLVGVDRSEAALEAARANAAAARVDAEWVLADATAAPFPDAAFDVLVADPPWGDAVGAAAELPTLYAALLCEAARLVRPGGLTLVVTHALNAFDAALREAGGPWREDGALRVFHGGHRPALRRLVRTGQPG